LAAGLQGKRQGNTILAGANVLGKSFGAQLSKVYRLNQVNANSAADYLANGLRFNAVCPGTVDTPSLRGRITELAKTLGSEDAARQVFLDRQPSGRLGRAEDIAGICAFLASDDAAFLTGQAINVDGGVTI
jgi:NAD(P)-dependent dehydrogenase (short-subunit alcohol dehydrogenase family)